MHNTITWTNHIHRQSEWEREQKCQRNQEFEFRNWLRNLRRLCTGNYLNFLWWQPAHQHVYVMCLGIEEVSWDSPKNPSPTSLAVLPPCGVLRSLALMSVFWMTHLADNPWEICLPSTFNSLSIWFLLLMHAPYYILGHVSMHVHMQACVCPYNINKILLGD